MLGQFAATKPMARRAYKTFVADGLAKTEVSPWETLVGQIVFGGETFASHVQERIGQAKAIDEIPRAQRFPGRPLLEIIFGDQENQTKVTRNNLIAKSHVNYGYTLKEIANQLDIHYTTVSKALKAAAQDKSNLSKPNLPSFPDDF